MPGDMGNAQRSRPVRLVGDHPANVQRGVALTDGVSFFEVKERQARLDGPWVYLQNMELGAGDWFRLADCAELRLAGSATHVREKQGFPS